MWDGNQKKIIYLVSFEYLIESRGSFYDFYSFLNIFFLVFQHKKIPNKSEFLIWKETFAEIFRDIFLHDRARKSLQSSVTKSGDV